jgi:hypothetical protein
VDVIILRSKDVKPSPPAADESWARGDLGAAFRNRRAGSQASSTTLHKMHSESTSSFGKSALEIRYGSSGDCGSGSVGPALLSLCIVDYAPLPYGTWTVYAIMSPLFLDLHNRLVLRPDV